MNVFHDMRKVTKRNDWKGRYEELEKQLATARLERDSARATLTLARDAAAKYKHRLDRWSVDEQERNRRFGTAVDQLQLGYQVSSAVESALYKWDRRRFQNQPLQRLKARAAQLWSRIVAGFQDA